MIHTYTNSPVFSNVCCFVQGSRTAELHRWAGGSRTWPCLAKSSKHMAKIVRNIWYPCSSHQNSWDSWMFIPLKMVLIGIDPYTYDKLL